MPNQTVTILNWNIQNFGETKAGYADLVDGIAWRVVTANPIPDIFILIELNTSKEATAEYLSLKMATALNNQSNQINHRDEFKVYVLSPKTGRETYAFFIRDATRTRPLIPVDPATDQIPAGIGGVYKDELTTVVFMESALTGGLQLLNGFCLYLPDIEVTVSSEYEKKKVKARPSWPAVRVPVLGMFWCATAKRLLPVVACHFAAKHEDAKKQFDTLKYFKLMNGMAPSAGVGSAPKGIPAVQVKLIGQAKTNVTPGTYVLTGDFNVDYRNINEIADYSVIEGNVDPALAAGVENQTHDTLLMTYGTFKAQRPKKIEDFPNRDYDNFCLRVSPTAGFTVIRTDLSVYLTPFDIQDRRIKLDESVKDYAELDKRGFISNEYADLVVNFAKQITGDKSVKINLTGALVGARLISDHLPVTVTYTIT